MKAFVLWSLSALLAYSLVGTALSAQCTQDKDSVCVFTCNGSTFNLSDVFQYPVKLTDSVSGYSYEWDPCSGVRCQDSQQGEGRNCAVCQTADRQYNCGHTQNAIFLLNNYYPSYSWTIQYPWGTDWRLTEITFMVDKDRDVPSIVPTGEQPYLQYNFVVTGKCIGQPYCQENMPDPLVQQMLAASANNTNTTTIRTTHPKIL